MASSSDDLFANAVGGDIDCLTELLKMRGPCVRHRLSINPTWQASIDAEDVMQVTYTEAFLPIDQLSGQTAEAFEAWLTRIAQNGAPSHDHATCLPIQRSPSPDAQWSRTDQLCRLRGVAYNSDSVRAESRMRACDEEGVGPRTGLTRWRPVR